VVDKSSVIRGCHFSLTTVRLWPLPKNYINPPGKEGDSHWNLKQGNYGPLTCFIPDDL